MADSGPGYRFTWGFHDIPNGSWVSVTGPKLPPGLAVRVNRHADGRYVLTGLCIGDDSAAPREITPAALREIKLSEIRAALFDDFASTSAPDELLTMPEDARGWADLYADQAGVVATGPTRGVADATLRDFAATYRHELDLHPHRAMTAAARAHNISRATANRWAAICRQLGYLPAGKEPS